MKSYNEQSFKYIVLDRKLNPLQDISDYVEEGGSIGYNSLTRLKASCTIPITLSSDDVLSIDAIRIYHLLNDTESCLGTFLISTPNRHFEDDVQTIELIGYSTLWEISNNSYSGRYYVSQGTNCIAEVKRILTSLGYAFYIADSTKTTSKHREWDVGAYYLDIINDLLETAGYTSLYVDAMGNYIATEYIFPEDRKVDVVLSENETGNIIEPQQMNILDKFNVYNKFICYVNNPETDLYAIYERVEGQTGTNNAPTNTRVEEITDAADYDTLYLKCKQLNDNSISIYNKIELNTAIQMLPTYLPTIALKHYQARGKYTCTSFTIPLEVGGSMTLNMRKSVNI